MHNIFQLQSDCENEWDLDLIVNVKLVLPINLCKDIRMDRVGSFHIFSRKQWSYKRIPQQILTPLFAHSFLNGQISWEEDPGWKVLVNIWWYAKLILEPKQHI